MPLTSTRRGISYPNPDRSDRPDIPLWIGNLIPALEADVVFTHGTGAARVAAAHYSGGGRIWWETDNKLLYYDDGAAWWPISPGTIPGTYAARPLANAVSSGTRYFATDTLGTWLTDGAAWTLVSQGRPRISTATFVAAPFSTVPYDNQEVTVVVDATNGVEWTFKYNSGSASAYKWESLASNTPLQASVTTDEASTANATWSDLTTVGPSIVLPLSGDMDFDEFALQYNGSGDVSAIAAKFGASAVVNTDRAGALSPGATGSSALGAVSIARSNMRRTGLASGTTVKMQYYQNNNANPTNYLQRTIGCRPVRVSTS